MLHKNSQKFDAPFEKLKYYESNRPDMILRKAIILQAVLDATNQEANSKKDRKIAIEAKDWIFEKGEYFQNICLEAEIAPESVISLAKHAIKFTSYAKKLRKLHRRSFKQKMQEASLL